MDEIVKGHFLKLRWKNLANTFGWNFDIILQNAFNSIMQNIRSF